MKPKLILMSHGKMAAETLHSAKMITGDLANAAIVSMTETDGLSGTTEKLKKILESSDQEPTLILADLKGGTPCNAAMMQMDSRPNLRVLSGLNLAMVIEAALSSIEDLDELVDHLLMIGKNAVEKIELPDYDEELEYEE
ncbi:PTS sugar transporter subunit IIA [Enterococcus termitis]|uniref:PTS fructose transporter subunit IIA n=1 Tax=Enterococcus termitis TaxID=332950 RepID=A0A1E5GYH3_9ENTE|nr:PTS sugar transporter subunit IIA [Enterococcus termitis]OEG17716.1 PTS fructose transporter subunit IIA [Enterococcus termitis]OJG96887.1 PTS system IIA component [Enterococcus termitis]